MPISGEEHYRRWGGPPLHRRFGSDLSQPLISNNSALISPAKANHTGRESWQILTLPTPLRLSVLLCWKFWGQGFGSSCSCSFPLQPSQRESIFLSCKRLLQQKMLGKEHMTSMLLLQARDLLPFVSALSHFPLKNLKQTTWQNILTLILSHYIEATMTILKLNDEWQDIIFSSDLSEKSNKKFNECYSEIMCFACFAKLLWWKDREQKKGR